MPLAQALLFAAGFAWVSRSFTSHSGVSAASASIDAVVSAS
jgi:hypothetical protein